MRSVASKGWTSEPDGRGGRKQSCMSRVVREVGEGTCEEVNVGFDSDVIDVSRF